MIDVKKHNKAANLYREIAELVSEEPITKSNEWHAKRLVGAMQLPADRASFLPSGAITFEWYQSPDRILTLSIKDSGWSSVPPSFSFALNFGNEQVSGSGTFASAIPPAVAALIALFE